MTSLGLYIHVPFCRCKCDWCAFSSEPGNPDVGPWLDRILEQLDRPPAEDARWTTVYLGGGTPSLLSPVDLDRLLSRVRDRLIPGAEVTMEANPESLVAEHLAVLAQGGGTRLSLGIQTFDETILARHGRPTRKHHLKVAQAVVRRWPGSLSLDLICGLEGQSAAGQRRDLDQALDWNPQHLSFYSLTVEPGTRLARRINVGRGILPSEDESAQWWLDGRDRLEAAGLANYEVSNFARPGAESVHNGRYWSLEPWWGLGPSATSLLPHPGSNSAGFEYRTEVGRLADWLGGQPAEVEVPTRLEGAKDVLLAGLRRTKGVDAHPWVDLLARTLVKWTGLYRVEGGRLFLTRQAFPYLNAFLRDAFADLDESPKYR